MAKMFENEHVRIDIDGYGARLWQKHGLVRIYFDSDPYRFVDLTKLAAGNLDHDVQSTNIKQFEFASEYDFKTRRWNWLQWQRSGYKNAPDCTVRVTVK